ncbi:hypothetical protein EMCRGX_G030946 [Ephydatia muelleri]
MMTYELEAELAEVAKRELNETPLWRTECLQEMREILESQGSSEDRDLSDETLVRFLRSKKFDVSRSVAAYKNYFYIRAKHPDIFVIPELDSVEHVWRANIVGILPGRDKLDRGMMLGFPGRWDPDTQSLDTVFAALMMQLDHAIKDVRNQVNGIVLLADFRDVSLFQASHITPTYVRLITTIVQNSFPARFKGVYIINYPWYINTLLTLIRPFLSAKMSNRVNLIKNLDDLDRHFHHDALPEEFGGSQPLYSNEEWIRTVRGINSPSHSASSALSLTANQEVVSLTSNDDRSSQHENEEEEEEEWFDTLDYFPTKPTILPSRETTV